MNLLLLTNAFLALILGLEVCIAHISSARAVHLQPAGKIRTPLSLLEAHHSAEERRHVDDGSAIHRLLKRKKNPKAPKIVRKKKVKAPTIVRWRKKQPNPKKQPTSKAAKDSKAPRTEKKAEPKPENKPAPKPKAPTSTKSSEPNPEKKPASKPAKDPKVPRTEKKTEPKPDKKPAPKPKAPTSTKTSEPNPEKQRASKPAKVSKAPITEKKPEPKHDKKPAAKPGKEIMAPTSTKSSQPELTTEGKDACITASSNVPTPKLITSKGNPRCNELGYAFGWKMDGGCTTQSGDFNSSGGLVYEGPTGGATACGGDIGLVGKYSVTCTNTGFATIEVDSAVGVLMKSGAGGSNLYDLEKGGIYKNLQTNNGSSGDKPCFPQAVSHVTFCFECPESPMPLPASDPESALEESPSEALSNPLSPAKDPVPPSEPELMLGQTEMKIESEETKPVDNPETPVQEVPLVPQEESFRSVSGSKPNSGFEDSASEKSGGGFAQNTCSVPEWVPQDNTASPTGMVRCCAGQHGKDGKDYGKCDTSSCVNNFNAKNRNCFNYGAPQNGKNGKDNQGSAICPYADSDHAICDTSYYDALNPEACRTNSNGKKYQVHCLGKVKCNTIGVKVPKNGHSDGTAPYDDSGETECLGAMEGFKAGDDCFYDGASENWKVCKGEPGPDSGEEGPPSVPAPESALEDPPSEALSNPLSPAKDQIPPSEPALMLEQTEMKIEPEETKPVDNPETPVQEDPLPDPEEEPVHSVSASKPNSGFVDSGSVSKPMSPAMDPAPPSQKKIMIEPEEPKEPSASKSKSKSAPSKHSPKEPEEPKEPSPSKSASKSKAEASPSKDSPEEPKEPSASKSKSEASPSEDSPEEPEEPSPSKSKSVESPSEDSPEEPEEPSPSKSKSVESPSEDSPEEPKEPSPSKSKSVESPSEDSSEEPEEPSPSKSKSVKSPSGDSPEEPEEPKELTPGSCGTPPALPYGLSFGEYSGNPQCVSGGSDMPFGFEYGWKMNGCQDGTFLLDAVPMGGGEIKGSCAAASTIKLSVICNDDDSATITWSGVGDSLLVVKMKGGNGGVLYDTTLMNGGTFHPLPGKAISHIEVCLSCDHCGEGEPNDTPKSVSPSVEEPKEPSASKSKSKSEASPSEDSTEEPKEPSPSKSKSVESPSEDSPEEPEEPSPPKSASKSKSEASLSEDSPEEPKEPSPPKSASKSEASPSEDSPEEPKEPSPPKSASKSKSEASPSEDSPEEPKEPSPPKSASKSKSEASPSEDSPEDPKEPSPPKSTSKASLTEDSPEDPEEPKEPTPSEDSPEEPETKAQPSRSASRIGKSQKQLKPKSLREPKDEAGSRYGRRSENNPKSSKHMTGTISGSKSEKSPKTSSKDSDLADDESKSKSKGTSVSSDEGSKPMMRKPKKKKKSGLSNSESRSKRKSKSNSDSSGEESKSKTRKSNSISDSNDTNSNVESGDSRSGSRSVGKKAHSGHGKMVSLQPFCGAETTGSDPLTLVSAGAFCEAKNLELPTKEKVCRYAMHSKLSFGKIATIDAGAIDVISDCPMAFMKSGSNSNSAGSKSNKSKGGSKSGSNDSGEDKVQNDSSDSDDSDDDSSDEIPSEGAQCPEYGVRKDEGVPVDPKIPEITKCQLKRSDVMLKYEPNFPKGRPDVYIEVEVYRTGHRYQFYPSMYEGNNGDHKTGLIPVENKAVFDILFKEQDDFGGQGFKMRYVSKNGPGQWNSCSYSPIAFDLNRDGKVGHIVDREVGYKIDITGDGEIEHLSEWFAPNEGILIDAHNVEGLAEFNNGVITGDHMMGDMAGTYTDGFAKLKTYDVNCDDELNGNELDGFYIWIDKNSNLKLDKTTLNDDDGDGELFTLDHFGIVTLSTIHDDLKSYAKLADGGKMLMHDLWFDGFSERRKLRSQELVRLRRLGGRRRLLEDPVPSRRLGSSESGSKSGKGGTKSKSGNNISDKERKADLILFKEQCEAAILCGPSATGSKADSPSPSVSGSSDEGPNIKFDSCGASPYPEGITFGSYSGNPQCSSGGSDSPFGFEFGWKMNGCQSGTFDLGAIPFGGGEIKGSCSIADGITIHVTCNADKSATITWSGEGTSNMAIKMKGGPGGELYDCSGVTGGTYFAGMNGSDTARADISHIEICLNCVGRDCLEGEPKNALPSPESESEEGQPPFGYDSGDGSTPGSESRSGKGNPTVKKAPPGPNKSPSGSKPNSGSGSDKSSGGFAQNTCSMPEWVPQDNTASPTGMVRCCAGQHGKDGKDYGKCDTSSCVNNFNAKNRNCFNYGAPQNGKNGKDNQGSAICPYADSDHAICDTSYYDAFNPEACRTNSNGKKYQVHCLGKVKCNTIGVKVPKNGHSDGTAPYDDSGETECLGAMEGFKAGDDCFYDGASENWKVCKGESGPDSGEEGSPSELDEPSPKKKKDDDDDNGKSSPSVSDYTNPTKELVEGHSLPVPEEQRVSKCTGTRTPYPKDIGKKCYPSFTGPDYGGEQVGEVCVEIIGNKIWATISSHTTTTTELEAPSNTSRNMFFSQLCEEVMATGPCGVPKKQHPTDVAFTCKCNYKDTIKSEWIMDLPNKCDEDDGFGDVTDYQFHLIARMDLRSVTKNDDGVTIDSSEIIHAYAGHVVKQDPFLSYISIPMGCGCLE